MGLDLSASRLRAVVSGDSSDRTIVLDSQKVDLALALAFDRKPITVGHSGYALIRKSPHQVCTNFLPHLTQAKVWKSGRSVLTADAALGTALAAAAPAVVAEAEAIGLAIPVYLTPPQAVAAAMAATTNKLPISGTVAAALAVVADRAAVILQGDPLPEDESDRPTGIVPIRSNVEGGPGSAVVLDVDDHAITASVVWVDRGEVRMLLSAAWTKLSSRAWKDRLLDAVSDRCVRLCRRDPRDSADAEQSLFEQLDAAMDASAATRPAGFHLRAAHWYQDVVLPPADFTAICSPLVNQAIAGLTDLIYTSGVPTPPRAIWLTSAAANLPGLSSAVYEHSAESTAVATLPADAVAAAAARLAPRWLAGELPRQHLDATIRLAPAAPALNATAPFVARRG